MYGAGKSMMPRRLFRTNAEMNREPRLNFVPSEAMASCGVLSARRLGLNMYDQSLEITFRIIIMGAAVASKVWFARSPMTPIASISTLSLKARLLVNSGAIALIHVRVMYIQVSHPFKLFIPHRHPNMSLALNAQPDATDKLITEAGLRRSSNQQHLDWNKDHVQYPRNWPTSRKAFETTVIVFLECYT